MTIKRPDGRKPDELRPIEAKVGVIPQADGSAMFKIGNTVAYVAVYGPRELYPRFLQNPGKGILRCNYNMMPFSGHGERVRPGGSRRSKEISMIMENALLPVLDLKDYPNTVVDVFVELPETDAGTRCAAITAASMALADAGLHMKDLVSAISIGVLNDEVLVDINGNEDCDLGASDIPIAMIPNFDQVTLLQMDGEVSQKKLLEAIEAGKKVCKQLYEIQKQALKKKFETE